MKRDTLSALILTAALVAAVFFALFFREQAGDLRRMLDESRAESEQLRMEAWEKKHPQEPARRLCRAMEDGGLKCEDVLTAYPPGWREPEEMP